MPGRDRDLISDQLRAALADDGRSLYEIAAAADVPRNSLSEFVAGTRQSLALPTVDRVAKALGLRLVQTRRRGRKA